METFLALYTGGSPWTRLVVMLVTALVLVAAATLASRISIYAGYFETVGRDMLIVFPVLAVSAVTIWMGFVWVEAIRPVVAQHSLSTTAVWLCSGAALFVVGLLYTFTCWLILRGKEE